MSFYDVHDAQISYMICNNCQIGAFAWMAQVFSCPKCGSSDFVFPEHDDESQPTDEKDEGAEAASQSNVGKLKRPGNDEGRSGR
jgi:hypothetical protein